MSVIRQREGELFPMYELEIRNSENEVMKTYSADQIYISDVFIEENMMTLNRVVKSGETYTVTSQDYISSNEEKEDKKYNSGSFQYRFKRKADAAGLMKRNFRYCS